MFADFFSFSISVTTEISKNGPYVDSENRLILSNANARHSGLYTCTGTNNITGDFASKSYDVTITSWLQSLGSFCVITFKCSPTLLQVEQLCCGLNGTSFYCT